MKRRRTALSLVAAGALALGQGGSPPASAGNAVCTTNPHSELVRTVDTTNTTGETLRLEFTASAPVKLRVDRADTMLVIIDDRKRCIDTSLAPGCVTRPLDSYRAECLLDGVVVERFEFVFGDGDDELDYNAPIPVTVEAHGNDDNPATVEKIDLGDFGGDNLDDRTANALNLYNEPVNYIDAGPGDDIVVGSSAPDTILGVDGADIISGGGGDDEITAGTEVDTVDGGDGNDEIDGGAGNDTVDGGEGDDHLRGADGDDVMRGGAGDDNFDASPVPSAAAHDGKDLLDGQGGTDHADYGARSADVNVTLSHTAATTGNDGTAGENDDLVAVENVTTGAGSDTVTATADTTPNVIITGTADTAADGDDTVRAGNGRNVVEVGDGTNWVTTGTGNDDISGGTGTDYVSAGEGANVVNAGDGANVVVTGTGADNITTGTGADNISSGPGADNISSGDGADVIDAGEGDDTIDAGAGNDGVAATPIRGGGGIDRVAGGAGNDVLDGGDGADSGDRGTTNTADDAGVYGGVGNDYVAGGAGDPDYCEGGAGVDTEDASCETGG